MDNFSTIITTADLTSEYLDKKIRIREMGIKRESEDSAKEVLTCTVSIGVDFAPFQCRVDSGSLIISQELYDTCPVAALAQKVFGEKGKGFWADCVCGVLDECVQFSNNYTAVLHAELDEKGLYVQIEDGLYVVHEKGHEEEPGKAFSFVTDIVDEYGIDMTLFRYMLRKIRKTHGKSVKKMAEMCGVSARTWEGWEQGRSTSTHLLPLFQLLWDSQENLPELDFEMLVARKY